MSAEEEKKPEKEEFTPRAPDYTLKIYDRALKKGFIVGAGWVNEKGHIRIKLNPHVQLPAGPEVHLTLWLRDQEKP